MKAAGTQKCLPPWVVTQKKSEATRLVWKHRIEHRRVLMGVPAVSHGLVSSDDMSAIKLRSKISVHVDARVPWPPQQLLPGSEIKKCIAVQTGIVAHHYGIFFLRHAR